jgi:hypothetical protein
MSLKISRTQQIIDEANVLLESSWDDIDKELLKRMVDSLIYYKRLIPNALKDDVKTILKMANRIKADYDILLEKYNKEIADKQLTELA